MRKKEKERGRRKISDPELITFCWWDEGEMKNKAEDNGDYR